MDVFYYKCDIFIPTIFLQQQNHYDTTQYRYDTGQDHQYQVQSDIR